MPKEERWRKPRESTLIEKRRTRAGTHPNEWRFTVSGKARSQCRRSRGPDCLALALAVSRCLPAIPLLATSQAQKQSSSCPGTRCPFDGNSDVGLGELQCKPCVWLAREEDVMVCRARAGEAGK
ncbi:hypothetical protein IF2G_05135 [Cordyceps javanica]|nr:hypothetical protein IF2G_05135 [Cordyceps javanica]